MTNFERIKQISLEEFLDIFEVKSEILNQDCFERLCPADGCRGCTREWLNTEVSE